MANRWTASRKRGGLHVWNRDHEIAAGSLSTLRLCRPGRRSRHQCSNTKQSRVASLVAEATDGKDPELVIAALLHDAIEDQEVPRGMIAEIWGEEVAQIVEEVTDDKSLPKDERKRKQINTAPKKSNRAKLIKLADKTSNLRAITASPSPEWSVKRRLEYVKWARDVVAAVRGTNEWLEAEFDKAAEAADEFVRP